MFRNEIPEPCWIPEEPHQEVWNRTIGGGGAAVSEDSLPDWSPRRRVASLFVKRPQIVKEDPLDFGLCF